jgi:cell division septum initiation protein DivIVA
VLLHYSTVISRLTDENVDLAQRIALLEERISQLGSDESREPGAVVQASRADLHSDL